MAIIQPYQNDDKEIDIPLLEVRCTQDENDESVNNSVHGKEDKPDDFEVNHIGPVRPEGKFKENIEGKFNNQGMVCGFCERVFGTFFYIKYHWCFSCPELGLSDRNKFISKFKMVRKCGSQLSIGHHNAKARGVRKDEDVTIINEKSVDRNATILKELEVLKKALKKKKMNKEKTDLLAKWILDEKTKQIKEETLDLEIEQVDEIKIDVTYSGSSLNN